MSRPIITFIQIRHGGGFMMSSRIKNSPWIGAHPPLGCVPTPERDNS
jgi:hypothetical protein